MSWVNSVKARFDKSINTTDNTTSHTQHKRKIKQEKLSETVRPTNPALHNVILIGESGVGKSTFINALANYLNYNTLENAERSGPITLVGTTFMLPDKLGDAKVIAVCNDSNEVTNIGESATQFCKSYKFNLGYGVFIRIIDTPGISDTKGTDQDKINFENVMKIIDACKEITAVCVVMKSDHKRFNDTFKSCLNTLFSQLHCSIKDNVVFLFSHGKGVNYAALEATTFVKMFFKQSNIEIKLTNDNMLCIENEAFNYLVAIKRNQTHNFINCDQSWNNSKRVSKRFINYVLSLKPHNVNDTVSINKTRQLIDMLTIPLVEISDFIVYCITKLDEMKIEAVISEDILQTEPEIVLETVEVDKPKLVCASSNCTKYDSNGKTVYAQTCCPDCGQIKHLKTHGSYVVFERKSLFGKRLCSECKCEESEHRIVYFESKITDKREYIGNIRKQNATDEEIIKNKSEIKSSIISNLELRYDQYFCERDTIIHALAAFYYYLKANSMAKYEDKFAKQTKDKFNYYKAFSSKYSQEFKNISEKYEEMKKKIKPEHKTLSNIDLEAAKTKLCRMQYNGDNIRYIYRSLDNSSGNFEISDEDCVDVVYLR